MKININEDNNLDEDEVVISCNKNYMYRDKIINYINSLDKKIIGIKDNKKYVIRCENIFYIESVDKRTFMYTNSDFYEISFKLYEVEKMNFDNFFRASKSTIINISKIIELEPIIGGRINVTLENKEHLIVSRQYVKGLKEMLEM